MSHCKPKHSVSCQVLLLTESWWASSCLWIHEGGFSPWTRELWESPQVALSPEQTRCDQIKPHRGSKSLRVALTWWLKHLLHSLDHCAVGIKTSLYACLAHQPALLMMDVCQNVGWGLGQQREAQLEWSRAWTCGLLGLLTSVLLLLLATRVTKGLGPPTAGTQRGPQGGSPLLPRDWLASEWNKHQLASAGPKVNSPPAMLMMHYKCFWELTPASFWGWSANCFPWWIGLREDSRALLQLCNY